MKNILLHLQKMHHCLLFAWGGGMSLVRYLAEMIQTSVTKIFTPVWKILAASMKDFGSWYEFVIARTEIFPG